MKCDEAHYGKTKAMFNQKDLANSTCVTYVVLPDTTLEMFNNTLNYQL